VDLLPIPPKAPPSPEPFLGTDLTTVPELAFEEPIPRGTSFAGCMRHNAHLVAKVNFLNQKEADGFLKTLVAHRSDLQGLPFVMGAAARANKASIMAFHEALAKIRRAQQINIDPALAGNDQIVANQFWHSFQPDQEPPAPGHRPGDMRPAAEQLAREARDARIAALIHELSTESVPMRLRLAQYLESMSCRESRRALAKLALFSADPQVRHEAVVALYSRDKYDYIDVLLDGLRYPWPEVARRAATALVELQPAGAVSALIDLLGAPDPLAPVALEQEGETAYVVPQLVRVNHHRNCLLCHAPIGTEPLPPQVETAPIPVPVKPLPVPTADGYAQSIVPDAAVRSDVTYLHPDFSLLLPVADTEPWPRLQRFDFVIRNVVLTAEQARVYEAKSQSKTAGAAPNRDAILAALRALTGVDRGNSAAEWRQALPELVDDNGRARYAERNLMRLSF
jgi:hypothetical protein